MSPSPQLTSEQQKGIIQDEKTTDKGAREVQEEVEDAEEVLDPDDSGSVLTAVPDTINK